jgi:F420-non-reducing hydrogenase iron-sulfur subunit
MSEKTTVITLMCERAADVNSLLTDKGEVKDIPGLHVVKLPCSGMVQTIMIDQAIKNGAEGVIVCGCQIGDCYYREGNKMIRERLLGERAPGLKKTVDRRRVVALWLSRLQKDKFVAEAKEFIARVRELPPVEAAKPAAAAAAKAATPAAKAEAVKADVVKPEAATTADAVLADPDKTKPAAEKKADAETKATEQVKATADAKTDAKAVAESKMLTGSAPSGSEGKGEEPDKKEGKGKETGKKE